MRRPAAKEGTEARGDTDISVVFAEGQEVIARDLPLNLWQSGQRLVFTRCSYWEEETQVAGVLNGLDMYGSQVRLKRAMEGTTSEALVKWVGASPGQVLLVHLCPVDCAKLCQDGLLHAEKVMMARAENKAPWMENLLGMGGRPEDADELERLRKRAALLGPGDEPGRQEKKVKKKRRSSSVSSGGEEAPDQKKKKKKRKEGEDKGGYVKGRRTSVWEHRIGPKPDQEKEVEEESKEGGQKEGQEGEQQLQSVRGNLQREQRFPGGGGSAVWPRSSGENGLEEVSRLFDNEHGRVHPECRGHPIGTALEFGVDGHPTYLQSILENDATTQDDRGHGSRDPDVELCPGPPTAGEGLGRLRRDNSTSQGLRTDGQWGTLHGCTETGVSPHRLSPDDQSHREHGGQQVATRRNESKSRSKSALGEKKRLGA